MDVHGMKILVPMRLGMGIWRFCSGRERTNVHGTDGLVPTPLVMGIWRCYSGQERTDVHGTNALVPMQLYLEVLQWARANECPFLTLNEE